MNLNKRIEDLEKSRVTGIKKWHSITCDAGEEESAINQYCEDKGITREALEGPNMGLIIQSIIDS